MNVVDSSGWLEYFAEGRNADFFAPPIEATARLVVPTLSLYEVFNRILQQCDEAAALQAIALMQRGEVVDLDAGIAVSAAKLSLELKLPLVDSVMLATARAHGATLWTQDEDFDGKPGSGTCPDETGRRARASSIARSVPGLTSAARPPRHPPRRGRAAGH